MQEVGIGADPLAAGTELDPKLDVPPQGPAALEASALLAHSNMDR